MLSLDNYKGKYLQGGIMDYYQILELENGASEKEIKRAYFKLIREYPPETHPKEFQNIRQAYEKLQDMAEEDIPEFERPKEKLEMSFRKQIDKLRDNGMYEECRDTCQEATRRFPASMHFLYDLAHMQILCGNTVKAVKTSELLVEKEPNNKWYQMTLALALIERNACKKAVPHIEKAYELGCRDSNFILESASVLHEQGKSTLAGNMLKDYLQKKKSGKKEEIPGCLSAFMGLICIFEKDQEMIFDIAERFIGFLKKYQIYFKEEYLEDNQEVMFSISTINAVLNKGDTQQEKEVREKVKEAIRTYIPVKTLFEFMEDMENMEIRDDFLHDERLSDDTKKFGTFYFFEHEIEEMDEIDSRFALLDTKLCLIMERKRFLEDLEIIDKEYPVVSKFMWEFANKIKKETDAMNLKESLQRQYTSMAEYCEPTVYFTRYPKEKEKSIGRIVYNNEEQTPYVREEKIGRNDPCPCGSGKKYKKCCGR